MKTYKNILAGLVLLFGFFGNLQSAWRVAAMKATGVKPFDITVQVEVRNYDDEDTEVTFTLHDVYEYYTVTDIKCLLELITGYPYFMQKLVWSQPTVKSSAGIKSLPDDEVTLEALGKPTQLYLEILPLKPCLLIDKSGGYTYIGLPNFNLTVAEVAVLARKAEEADPICSGFAAEQISSLGSGYCRAGENNMKYTWISATENKTIANMTKSQFKKNVCFAAWDSFLRFNKDELSSYVFVTNGLTDGLHVQVASSRSLVWELGLKFELKQLLCGQWACGCTKDFFKTNNFHSLCKEPYLVFLGDRCMGQYPDLTFAYTVWEIYRMNKILKHFESEVIAILPDATLKEINEQTGMNTKMSKQSDTEKEVQDTMRILLIRDHLRRRATGFTKNVPWPCPECNVKKSGTVLVSATALRRDGVMSAFVSGDSSTPTSPHALGFPTAGTFGFKPLPVSSITLPSASTAASAFSSATPPSPTSNTLSQPFSPVAKRSSTTGVSTNDSKSKK